MPEEKHPNPYPTTTAEEFIAAPGTREEKAARCIAARKFEGIPTRAFLLGDNDHSPVMQGIRDLTGAVYELLDSLEGEYAGGDVATCASRVRSTMEDHRCPTSAES